MIKAILELITIGANIFKDERTRHFQSQSEKLMNEIQEVEDSDFYKKDLEAKGKAERELETKAMALKAEYIKEATK